MLTFGWNTMDSGFYDYAWVQELPDGTKAYQYFTVNYAAASSFDCSAAIWSTSLMSTTISLTEQYGDFSSSALPDASTDVEIATGSSSFCGDRSYLIKSKD